MVNEDPLGLFSCLKVELEKLAGRRRRRVRRPLPEVREGCDGRASWSAFFFAGIIEREANDELRELFLAAAFLMHAVPSNF